jgi:NAD+ synthase
METASRHTEDLSLNVEMVQKLLVDFLRDEIRNAGFSKGIVGLSGGVDSSVSAFLAVKALGKGNVIGVLMPYRTSNQSSADDARLVVQQLGISSERVDITPMVDPFLSSGRITDRVRAGNVMARQRMIVLYDISSRESALVIGTSNKTEILLGYGTLYGDTACAVNPLGDLYKTQVWQLARALGVPANIIEKTPSADLWEGQTDEGELGFSYRRVDRLLFHMVDERRSDTELEQMGFEAQFVESVRNLIRKNRFKSRPPLIARISTQISNVDFRNARDLDS